MEGVYKIETLGTHEFIFWNDDIEDVIHVLSRPPHPPLTETLVPQCLPRYAAMVGFLNN